MDTTKHLALISLLFCILFWVCSAQQQGYPDVSHIAVRQNAAMEASFPPNLLNPFYKNPRIRAALARSSWFGPGETPVYQREADKASRKDIYTVLNHAGLLPERKF